MLGDTLLSQYAYTKFGIPTSKNIGDMHRTGIETEGQMDGGMDSAITICLPKVLWGHQNSSVKNKVKRMIAAHPVSI